MPAKRRPHRTTKPTTAAPHPDAKFLSRRQVADRTGLNLELIDRAIHAGDLTASKVGRRVLIGVAAVDAWIAGQQI